MINTRRNWEELGRRLPSNGAKSALGGAAQPCALEMRAQATQLTRVTFPLHSAIFSSNAARSRETLCPAPTLRRSPDLGAIVTLQKAALPLPVSAMEGRASGGHPASVFSTQIWERVSGSGEGGAGVAGLKDAGTRARATGPTRRQE